MEIDLTAVYAAYAGKWVALNEKLSEVVASGSTPSVVLTKAKKSGYKKPILFKVPSENVPYVGSFL